MLLSQSPADTTEDGPLPALLMLEEFSHRALNDYMGVIGMLRCAARELADSSARAVLMNAAQSLDDGRVEAPAVGDHGAAVMSAIVVRELLGQLKPAQVDAITLVKLQGFSVEEASRMTGQSASLIKINIHRGLAKARGCCQTTIGSRLPELRSQKVH